MKTAVFNRIMREFFDHLYGCLICCDRYATGARCQEGQRILAQLYPARLTEIKDRVK